VGFFYARLFQRDWAQAPVTCSKIRESKLVKDAGGQTTRSMEYSEVESRNRRRPNLFRRKQARRYARRGWLVVPMHTIKHGICSCKDAEACERPGKHPRTPHGVKDATTNSEQINAWWEKWPRSNIGVAAGDESGIVVLDIDPRHDGDETIVERERELGALPATVTSLSGGGGRHLFFKHPRFAVRKDTAGKMFGSGVDLLSNGSIVILPRSRHASGNRYRWEGGKSFRDLEPAPLPEPWLDRLRGNTAAQPNADSAPAQSARLVREGSRNNHLTSLAGSLQRNGASPETITAALKAENAANCTPPLDSAEVERIVASVTTYPAAPFGDGADAAEGLMQLSLYQHFSGGKHLMLSTDGRFWHYDIRVWRVVPDQWVSGKVLETIQSNPVKNQKTASLLGQVITLLKAKLAVKDDLLSYLANPPSVINCSNGELWIAEDGSVELRPHRPESYLRHCLHVAYDPDASCPEYDRALREIFGCADNPKAMRRHWNEFVGYVIQPRRNIASIVILLGDGDNGKTVLIRTVIRLLGDQLVHAQRVEDLDKNRFVMGSLFGKYLFVDDDVKAGARLPDGMLKTISEAKEVSAELKYLPSFNFVVRTVPVLLCNNIPSLADLSRGMQRRLMVIPFDRRFTDEDRDPELFERIWAKELPGVLNRALAGYQRLVKRGAKFKRPAAVKAATKRWLQQANPLPAFIESNCIEKADGRCLMQDFYVAYANWTQAMGYTMTQTKPTVTRNLEHLRFATKKTNQGLAVLGLVLADRSND
jgi:putative DNA primase/helicase